METEAYIIHYIAPTFNCKELENYYERLEYVVKATNPILNDRVCVYPIVF